MEQQTSIELRGMIMTNDGSGTVEHGAFLQEFQAFLEEKSWTFFGSTKQLTADVHVMPDVVPMVEGDEQ